MSVVAMSGNDTILINGSLLTDLADGNVGELVFEADIANVKTGKNGNSIYGLNQTGKVCKVTLRIIRGGATDGFLNGLLAAQNNNFAGTVLMIGQFIKKIGDGAGNITSDTYNMSGGIFTKQVDAMSNTDGETNQSVAVYTMKFSNAPRVLT